MAVYGSVFVLLCKSNVHLLMDINPIKRVSEYHEHSLRI